METWYKHVPDGHVVASMEVILTGCTIIQSGLGYFCFVLGWVSIVSIELAQY